MGADNQMCVLYPHVSNISLDIGQLFSVQRLKVEYRTLINLIEHN